MGGGAVVQEPMRWLVFLLIVVHGVTEMNAVCLKAMEFHWPPRVLASIVVADVYEMDRANCVNV